MSESNNVVHYREPPRVVVDVLDAPPTPLVALSPDARHVLFVDHTAMPSIADVARPMERLAGLRIDPSTNAHHQTVFGVGLRLSVLGESLEREIVLPAQKRIASLRWSHDTRHFACLLVDEAGTSLWLGDTSASALTLVVDRVNAVLTSGFEWMPDGVRLLVSTIPATRGEKPAPPSVPRGPKVLETRGETSPLRTYQDLLAGEHDELLFEHYARSELVLCDPRAGSIRKLLDAGLLWDFDASPDARWVLATSITRPYSYSHPYTGFPTRVEAQEIESLESVLLADLPTAENVPIEGVRTGPRNFSWDPHHAARLAWLEALDGGDPRRAVPHRDRWMQLDAPFSDAPREFLRVEHRAGGLSWLAEADQFLVRDYDRDRRWTRLRHFVLGEERARATLDDRSIRDRYGDPGAIWTETLRNGRRIARERGGRIFRAGQGETANGPRPFLDAFDLRDSTRERLFESATEEIESPVALVDGRDHLPRALVTRHESALSPPNLRLRTLGASTFQAITRFADPAPILRRIRRESLVYTRADGVQLSGELYLPPDWNGERLPIVLWAYPDDYVDAGTASQVSSSKHRFTRIAGPSHLFFALQGYAVLDDASMPVVGPPETMNDTFIEQTVASARAAIEKLDALGIGDPARVGVGGHSYGAFMTACLLAHSSLFKAGIAKSGAYNRTLTPFGFQAERRTLWEAPESYQKLSPFLSAHTIKAPLLLVHGEKDENPGTHYLQSERLFQAIKGNGGIARFVSLPHEGHGYRARESILHVLAEQIEWFERHVKGV